MKKCIIALLMTLLTACSAGPADLETDISDQDVGQVGAEPTPMPMSLLGVDPASLLTYVFCSNEFATCRFTGSKTVRFGLPGKYVYKAFVGQTSCTVAAFGYDPAPGLNKVCSTSTDVIVPVDPSTLTYAFCSNEFSSCNFVGKKTARFGLPGKYVYKELAGPVSCSVSTFGKDPSVGDNKVCSVETAAAPVVDASVPVKVDASVPPTPGTAKRPSYNKGVGFYVLNGKLYDANDKEFVMRGVNKVHWDNTNVALNKTNSNTTRWTMDFRRPVASNVSLLKGDTGSAGTIAQKQVIVPGNWDGTCKEDPSYVTAGVDTWVAQAEGWKSLEKYMILNIMNEWGPNDSALWRDTYITAIARLRAAGYRATIMIDAGGCGQDPYVILKYGQAVFNSDPEKNVMFDQHVYGYYGDPEGGATGGWSNMPSITKQFKDLAATGLVVVIGEFGPGRNIGPSPTDVRPERVMQVAQENGLGWLAWAADDGDSSNCDGKWFCMFKNTAVYNTSNDLTLFGQVVIEHPVYGLKVVAKPASIF